MAITKHVQKMQKHRSRRGFPLEPPRIQARTISTHFSAELVRALEAYISSQPEPKPIYSKVINTAVTEWLTDRGLLPDSEPAENEPVKATKRKISAGA